MKLPGILSVVALQAMARTPACSARNASRSVAAAVLCTTQAFSRPLTTTGLSGPSNRTSFFSLGILNLCSHQHAHRRFDQFLERGQQLGAERTVDHAVVAGHRDAEQARERDAAIGLFYRLAPRRTDPQNSRMWRIDEGGEFAHAVQAEIRNARRAALELVGREFLGARARQETRD